MILRLFMYQIHYLMRERNYDHIYDLKVKRNNLRAFGPNAYHLKVIRLFVYRLILINILNVNVSLTFYITSITISDIVI